MENASKALIIAGAILVSILLISIGVMVIQSTGNVQQGMQETMNSSAAQQFNAKWDPYLGKQSATTTKGLFSAVTANNAASAHDITITGKTLTQITTESSYTITVTGVDDAGYYTTINIQ